MTATHTTPRRTRKTPARRTVRIPSLGWGWAILALVVIAAAKTWPIYTALVAAVAAIGCITAARRPAWLQHAAHRLPPIDLRRRHTLSSFLSMDPTRFEHAITRLAASHPDVAHAEHAGRSADRGVDVLVTLRSGHRILLQCKHHTTGHNVGGDTVREIVGSVIAAGAHHGAIVTTSGFTSEAVATNATLGSHALTLMPGPALEAWANGGRAPW